MTYYYGWDRLDARTHERIGWIYFWSAWLSLVVINGILSFMLTPGTWPTTRHVLDAFLNPTYFPSVAGRTCVAVGLAGLYALLTASWLRDRELKARVARYAGLWWVVPMAIALPLSLVWYLSAAAASGVPVGEILGAKSNGFSAIATALFAAHPAGNPIAQSAAAAGLAGSIGALLMTLVIVLLRAKSFGPLAAGVVIVAGFVAFGGAEWTREDLRKPYVIGQYMLVNGVRLPPPDGAPGDSAAADFALESDRFTIDALNRSGVLGVTPWVRLPAIEGFDASAAEKVSRTSARGAEVFRLECGRCHTIDGYLAIRPLVAGKSASAIGGIVANLARPVDGKGQPTRWNDPGLRLATWRGRRMPPFVGTFEERADLTAYLAELGGQAVREIAAGPGAAADVGRAYFEEHCAACHGQEADWPMSARVQGRTADQLFVLFGRLSSLNDAMPAFEGTDEQRRAVAVYVATLGAAPADRGGRR
jgi:mono/diheme cytochrome c family protein